MRGMDANPYRSPQETGYAPGGQSRTEYGGLRWGHSFWVAKNATWPLATWTIAQNSLAIKVSFPIPMLCADLVFTPADVLMLRPFRGITSIISPGIKIEHCRPDYPPFILFWSFFNVRSQLADAGAAGFTIAR